MRLSEHSQLKPGLMLLAIAIIGVQVLWISQQFDARALTLRGDVSGWRALFGELGNAAKLIIAIAFTIGLLLHTRFMPLWQSLQPLVSWRRFATMLPLQLMAFGLLMLLTNKIFADPKAAATLPAGYFVLWLLACSLTFITWLSLFSNHTWWIKFLRQEKLVLIIGACVGTMVWALAMYTRELWGPMSELTFFLAALLLYAINSDDLVIHADEKILGLGDFAVNIAPACSGYEGVGLVTAFTAIYLWLYRHQLRFPRVLLLFPLAATAIWLLNVLRIDVLILIGYHWSPEVAVGGFHSQAGWLTFIITSLVILWLAGESPFFSRTANPVHSKASTPAKPSPPAHAEQAVAMIVPLMALLASSLLTSSLSAGFDWLYPVRVLAVGIAVAYVWPQLRLLPYRLHPLSPIAGLATAIIWVALLGDDADFNTGFSRTLNEIPTWQAGAWLVLRFLGTAVTVPIAEELAFRGYLLCKLSGVQPVARGHLPFSIFAVVVSSIAFGALHGAWFAGTVAGLIYAIVRMRTDHVGDAIVAHSVTNALLFAYAGFTGAWHLL